VTVRNTINALKVKFIAMEQEVLPDPGNLKQFSTAAPGDAMLFKVKGKTTGGSVWGTDVYTTDSALALTAVHTGVLKDGEEGVVRVVFASGQAKYEGTTRNGVQTSSWGSYDLSYRVEPLAQQREILPDPGNLKKFTNAAPGDVMFFRVKGKISGGSLWGTDVYTTDSALALAAVHAGALGNGKEGVVKVTFMPGQAKYEGATRNGVSSSSWGSYDISYKVETAQP
jgi:hypothetical protein